MHKLFFRLLLACFLFLVYSGVILAEEVHEHLLEFEWVLLVKEWDTSTGLYKDDLPVLIADEPVRLKTGSRYKILYQALVPVYFYVFKLDKGGKLFILFPDKVQEFRTIVPKKNLLFVPARHWLEAEAPDTESIFYLIVSREPLEKMTGFGDNFRQFSRIAYKQDKSEQDLAVCEALSAALVRLNKEYMVPAVQTTGLLTVSGSFKSDNKQVNKIASREPYYIKQFVLHFD